MRSLLETVEALGVILWALFGSPALSGPWSFVLGFVFGVLLGFGATLVVSGLIDRRHGG